MISSLLNFLDASVPSFHRSSTATRVDTRLELCFGGDAVGAALSSAMAVDFIVLTLLLST